MVKIVPKRAWSASIPTPGSSASQTACPDVAAQQLLGQRYVAEQGIRSPKPPDVRGGGGHKTGRGKGRNIRGEGSARGGA